jgi:hypothetical protein
LDNLVNNLLNGAQIIAGFVAAIALFITYFTFRNFGRSEEIKLSESVFKDIRSLEEQKSKVEESSPFPTALLERRKDWASLFFNTLEWLSFLINNKKIKDKKIISFFKKAIIDWYDDIFLDTSYITQEQVEDSDEYRELKKLYKELTEGKYKVI